MDNLEVLIRKLYPRKSKRVIKEIHQFQQHIQPATIPAPNYSWYKNISLYTIYPDVLIGRKHSPLANLVYILDHVKDLGCNAIHILPFLKSPMIDKGFDVSDYFHIRQGLGTMQDIQKITSKAHKLGIRVFMDLVFNHISDQHEWFQKAQSGDQYFRDFFIHQKTKPQFIEKTHEQSAVWASYKVNGKKQKINIAFPEQTGEIPHWRQGIDGYWYYHTYYPEQLDMNWHNPNVFIEFAKVILFWAELGFNFRLDAIPFIGKSAYKETDNDPVFVDNLIQTLTILARMVNPETVFIAETYENIKTVRDYFGDTNNQQAQLAYNFHLATALWVTLVNRDTSLLWQRMKEFKQIPVHGEWINFLRNHDELSLAHLPEKTVKQISKTLLPNGAPFREGYGIAGRTYSLLGNDQKRFLNAYFLLMSLPGGVLIPYGDEIGKKNLSDEAMGEEKATDTRNINRGLLTKDEMISEKADVIFQRIRSFLKTRQILCEYDNIWPQKIAAPKEVFAGRYTSGSSELIVAVNTSDKPKKIALEADGYRVIEKLFTVAMQQKTLELSPYSGIWLQK
jgi:maltose alpha-D-glucosyltransferase/alpha-amylase